MQVGYRHIDTTWEYDVHEEVGHGLKAAMNARIERISMHLGWRNDKMLEACKKNGIRVTVLISSTWIRQ
ncbi:hypothetical protein L1887_21528 [Cichorium endivia]|nr:hypothetical protein L1887_21528 [Cichorium endivia]